VERLSSHTEGFFAMSDSGIIAFVTIFYIAVIVFIIAIYWQIWRKAGYAGAWSLLMLVPLANIIALCYLAFSDWPVSKRLRALESGGGPMPPR
jgi:uncharacterized membrane protein YhaH (DUF805 family)